MLFANSLDSTPDSQFRITTPSPLPPVTNASSSFPEPHLLNPMPYHLHPHHQLCYNPTLTNADIIKMIRKVNTEINYLKTRIRQLQGCCEIYAKLKESELKTRRWKILYLIELDKQQHQQ